MFCLFKVKIVVVLFLVLDLVEASVFFFCVIALPLVFSYFVATSLFDCVLAHLVPQIYLTMFDTFQMH